jgi:hypothetical protein
MKFKGNLAIVLSFLLLYVPLAPAATSSPAVQMVTNGNAAINGVAAPKLTSVFAGDRIATEKQSVTSLTFPGGDGVVIPELSKAMLGEKDGRIQVNLEDGTLSVMNKSNSPIEIVAGGARIRAAENHPAVFAVTLHGNALHVVTTSGAAFVETANKSGEVPTGMALDATFAPAPPQSQPAGSNGMFGTTTWVLIGAAAAAGLGIGIYEATKSSSASPVD